MANPQILIFATLPAMMGLIGWNRTDVEPSLVQQIFDVAQRERVADAQHPWQADDLWAGLEVPEGGALGHLIKLGDGPIMLKELALTTPDAPLIFAESQSVTIPK